MILRLKAALPLLALVCAVLLCGAYVVAMDYFISVSGGTWLP